MVFNPQTEREEEITLTRVAIHGSFKENPYLDPQYIATLMAIKDPNRRKAWVEGSWDVTSGGRFDHLWNEALHVIKPFRIPDSWTVDRSHDWGESKPFSNLWWAQADGTAAELSDGRQFCPPAGSLILIGEWYGCPPDELNKGLNMSSTNVAKGVAWIDKRLVGEDVDEPEEIQIDGVTQGQLHIMPGICSEVIPGPADGAIFNTGDNELSIAQKMEAQGVTWLPADKKPGSRINGASLFADMLEAVVEGVKLESGMPEKPAFYVFDYCRGWISRIPVLVRDDKNPDDVDTQQEDHDWDGTRYRVLHSPQKITRHVGAIALTEDTVNESENKQLATNASIDRERMRYVNALFNGTSNTKRQRLYQEFGYPKELCFDDFYRAYRRNAIVSAAVTRMVDGCWEDYPEVYEGDQTKDATQQTDWDKRVNKLLKRCWKQIKGADKRNLVGRYSALLIQVKDNRPWSEPVDKAMVGRLQERALVRLVPVWEAQLDPVSYNEDQNSENYGAVSMYSFTEIPVQQQRSGQPGRIINVHPDRVIILAEGSDDGRLDSGESLLEEGFNKLLDLEKVSGGAAEGFLKNAS